MINRKCAINAGASWVPWTQPVLSANGTLGGASFAVSASSIKASMYDAYKAFNNVAGFGQSWSPSASNGEYLIFYNPFPLRVASISTLNGSADNRAMPTGTVFGSDDGATWVQICTFTNSNQTKNATWNITVNSPTAYKYHKLLCTSPTPSELLYVEEIDVTATYQA